MGGVDGNTSHSHPTAAPLIHTSHAHLSFTPYLIHRRSHSHLEPVVLYKDCDGWGGAREVRAIKQPAQNGVGTISARRARVFD